MSGPSYIRYHAVDLGFGRAVMRREVVIDGEYVAELSGTTGSPAPIETVRQHERMVGIVGQPPPEPLPEREP